MDLQNQNILLTSNEPWGNVWFSKHNVAYELSKTNRVFFLDPPVKWKPRNLIANSIAEEKYSDSLSIIYYQNYLPILNDYLNELNNFLVSKALRNFFQKKGVRDCILWAFDQNRLYRPKQLQSKFSVYHCADHCYFKIYGEKRLCDNSDVIFCVSQYIADFYSQINKPKYVIPHAISNEVFALDPDYKLDIELENYGLFVGVIDARLDFELIEKAVIKFPQETFLFVGPLKLPPSSAAERIFIEKKYSNVISIGERPFKTLKYYINRSKFCISFMDKEFPGNKIGHHKTQVYLSQGKPVFGPVFSDYVDFGKIMYMEDNNDKLLDKLSDFLQNGEDQTLGQKRIELAKSHSYENLLRKINNIIQSHTPDIS